MTAQRKFILRPSAFVQPSIVSPTPRFNLLARSAFLSLFTSIVENTRAGLRFQFFGTRIFHYGTVSSAVRGKNGIFADEFGKCFPCTVCANIENIKRNICKEK